MRAILGLAIVLCCPVSLRADEQPSAPSSDQVSAALQRGIGYLLENQNSNGSWGGPQNAINTFTGPVWSNPETHRSWRVATTGLCCLALMKVGQSGEVHSALERGVDYLVNNAVVKRPSEWDVDNNWAYIYGLHGLAVAHGDPRLASRRDAMAPVIDQLIQKLARYQSLSGGWGYYDFEFPTEARPRWATSFTTAAAVIALQQARLQGFDVDEKMIGRAVRGIKRCRLPNGAYTYSILAVPDPRHSEWIDQIKGSLSRIQVCHEALLQSGEEITSEELKTGLGHFFRDHRFLDVARNRPIPHEAYYLNSGYFYLFGHYYTAQVISRLSQQDQRHYWPKLQYEVMKTQQQDGSMWDFEMHSYSKPYGISFGLLTLGRSLDPTVPSDTIEEPVQAESELDAGT